VAALGFCAASACRRLLLPLPDQVICHYNIPKKWLLSYVIKSVGFSQMSPKHVVNGLVSETPALSQALRGRDCFAL
jgi:hypothetical protein